MTNPLEAHLLAQASDPQISFWHRLRATPVIDQLPLDSAVLADIGAGAGSLGLLVKDRCPTAEYRFFEPLDSLARLVEQRTRGTRLKDPSDLEGTAVVALLDVIEHLQDPRVLLTPVIDAAEGGAIIVITVPALPGLWSSWDEQLGHHRRYTRRSLVAEMAEYPIDLVEVSYLFPELVPAGIMRRLLDRRSAATTRPAADFPDLPRWLDAALYGLGRLSYRLRRWWPLGTSLLLIARRRD